MTNDAGRTVAVMGATGRFGAVVPMLIQRGHRVRAGTRNVNSEAADRLREVGAEVVRADFDDPDSIASAARKADVVFASGTAHRAGPDGELRHGRNLVGALAAAEIGQLVFVSGAGADVPTRVPILEAKRGVEAAIHGAGLRSTVVAPAYLMENLFNPWNLAALHAGTFPSPIPPSSPMQQSAVDDVLAVATLIIGRAEEFAGERIEIASDQLAATDAAAILSRSVGVPLHATGPMRDGLPPGVVAIFEWLERNPAVVDTNRLQRRLPDVSWRSFEVWARQNRIALRMLLGKEARRACCHT